VAVPAATVLVVAVYVGGAVFAAVLIVVAILGVHELYRMTGRAGPLQAAGFIATAGVIAAALLGGPREMVLALAATIPLTLAFALADRDRTGITRAVAITALGVAWIGLGLAHGVLLRELPHGTALVIDVLLATFIGDTGAHLIGAAFGRTPLAPRVSPAKTVEGLVAGILVGTLSVLAAALLFQPWLEPWQAVVLGFAAAVAAPCGDLFESLLKRDLGVKDTGTVFGAHGGVLDRADAAVLAAVAGYYVSLVVT
jgi:phosphatidate cytidylyltransferase